MVEDTVDMEVLVVEVAEVVLNSGGGSKSGGSKS